MHKFLKDVSINLNKSCIFSYGEDRMKRKKTIIIVAVFLALVLLASIFSFLMVAFMFNKTEFVFATGDSINEKQLYPESHDGRIFYVAAEGGNINDYYDQNKKAGTTPENPLCLSEIKWFTRPDFNNPNWEEKPFFKAGDQILLKKGDVFKTNLEIHFCSGTQDNPITIASYGQSPQRPLIEITHKEFGGSFLESRNSGAAGVILDGCSNIVVRDLEINIKWTSRRNPDTKGAGGIIAEYEQVGNNKYENVYIVNNVIHSECLESENPYEANTYGIKLNSYELSYESSPDDFVLCGGFVTNNLIYNLGRSGIIAHGWIQEGSMPQMKFTLLKDIHLDNNVVHDVGTIGIYAGAATGCTMNRNLVYNTGMYVCDLETEENPQEGEGGLMSMCLKDGEIKYNVTYNNYRQGILNDGIGIDIDWNSMNIVVQYNYVYGCDGSGIGTMANCNCKIINNRVFDNRIITNHPGQISVCDFVPFGDDGETARKYIGYNSPDLLTVRNLEIAENFISASPKNGESVNPDFPNKCLFYARHGNGIGDWIGNSFHDNHVVYSGTGSDFFFNMIVNESSNFQDSVTWDKFQSNKYFAKNLSSFICLDESMFNRNSNEGSLLVPVCSEFSSWLKRDIGSTFETYTPEVKPGKPSKAKVEFKDGKLSLSWKKSKGDVWHYNIFKVKEGEEISYRNLLEQTKITSFDFAPEEKGEFYIVIQPENNMGEVGETLKLKISLN